MSTDSSSDSRSFMLVSLGWLAKLLKSRSILSKRESTKAEIRCSLWSSWMDYARSTVGRKGRLLVGGGFAFSILKNGIGNENYEDCEKANRRKLNSHLKEFKQV
ncbi:hypothetical protein Tco_0171174 [Tanacetum coccineum]